MSSNNFRQRNNLEDNFVIKDKPKRKPIYIMTLELEKGNPKKIEIYPDSDPHKLAINFCKTHNLDYNGLDYLIQKIGNLLKQNNDKNKSTSSNDLDLKHYNNFIQNKENTRNDNKSNIINTSSKTLNKKTKSRIIYETENNKYKDNKKENKYNRRLKNKIKQIENSKVSDIEEINHTHIIKPIIKYKSVKNKDFKRKEDEKELFQLKQKINRSKNNRNKRNNKYHTIFTSKSNKYKTKDNICSRISKEYEKNQFSFHPSINENYKTDLTFAERQAFYKNLYIKRKNELNKFYLQKKDKNGNLLFRPSLISKAFYEKSYKKKNLDEEDIFQKNYQIYKKYDLKKENLIKKYKNDLQQSNQVIKAKRINEKIFKENKIKAFKNIFNDLDSDQDGIISGININIKKIPKKIIDIIQPLLIELKEDNQTLNKDEFILAMNEYFEDISFIEKREIINIYKNISKKNKSLDLKCNNSQRAHIEKNYTYNNFYTNKSVNTCKLANNYYKKITRLFDELSNSNKIKNKNDNILKRNKEIAETIFKTNNNFNNNISDCTFNNYIKSLN